MDTILTIFLNLLITAVAYLILPIVLCVIGKPITLSQIKKVVIVNGICVWLIFTIIRIESGIDGTSAAVLLWSSVAYWLMKKRCLKTEEKHEIKHETKHEQKYSVTPIQTNKMSLSNIGEVPKQYGDYNVYGSDISLKTEEKTKNDDIADIVIRLSNDEEFLSAVMKISELDKEKLSSLLRFL